jgi:hypothetical protein
MRLHLINQICPSPEKPKASKITQRAIDKRLDARALTAILDEIAAPDPAER